MIKAGTQIVCKCGKPCGHFIQSCATLDEVKSEAISIEGTLSENTYQCAIDCGQTDKLIAAFNGEFWSLSAVRA